MINICLVLFLSSPVNFSETLGSIDPDTRIFGHNESLGVSFDYEKKLWSLDK